MMDLIHKLYRYLAQHQLTPENIKITIEFLNPETQARAEYLLKTQAYATVFDPKMIDAICDERPWKMYGLNFQVKTFKSSPVAHCNCAYCIARRDAMR